MHIAEVFDSFIKASIRLAKPNFIPLLNLPDRDPMMIWSILTENSSYVLTLFTIFITKINFAIENKVVFNSALTAGHLFNEVITNFKLLCESTKVKNEILNELK